MRASPTWLEVVLLLVSLGAIPANMVQPIVRADRLNDVRGLPITSFATVDLVVLPRCHGLLLILSLSFDVPPSHKTEQVALCSINRTSSARNNA